MGQVPVLKGKRLSEVWRPYQLELPVSGTALKFEVADSGTQLRVIVTLEPSWDTYCLYFDRMNVVSYAVSIVDRINHVTVREKNALGGIYILEGSEFHLQESLDFDGQYTSDGTIHLAIPAVDMTIEFLTLVKPDARILVDGA